MEDIHRAIRIKLHRLPTSRLLIHICLQLKFMAPCTKEFQLL